MLTLRSYKIIFVAFTIVGVLSLLTPALMLALPTSAAEKFSQIWVLGSNQTTSDYPFNVTTGGNYTVYLGIANHLASTSYYVVAIKFRNESDSLPDQTLGMPSSLPALYDQRVVLQDNGTWEQPLNFSFSDVSISGNKCTVGTLKIGNNSILVNKSASWDYTHNGYYYQLFFELWIFNPETQALQFHNRYCGLWLNMTSVSGS